MRGLKIMHSVNSLWPFLVKYDPLVSVMEGSVSDSNDWHESILSQLEQHEKRSYLDRTSDDAQFEIYNSVNPH